MRLAPLLRIMTELGRLPEHSAEAERLYREMRLAARSRPHSAGPEGPPAARLVSGPPLREHRAGMDARPTERPPLRAASLHSRQ